MFERLDRCLVESTFALSNALDNRGTIICMNVLIYCSSRSLMLPACVNHTTSDSTLSHVLKHVLFSCRIAISNRILSAIKVWVSLSLLLGCLGKLQSSHRR
jgi:hypothetical protein